MTLSSRLTVAILTCGVCGGIWAQPITSFETEDSLAQFQDGGVNMQRVQEHASDGEWALKLSFPGDDKDTWPGISFMPQQDTSQYHMLAFDIHNPSEQPVSLSMRIDPKQGKAIFTGASVRPKGTTRVEFWLAGIGPIKKFYPYIRMPREDYTLYFDNFAWAKLTDRFTPLEYVDDAPAPTPTDEETQQGAILFQRPFSDPVFENAKPRAHERLSVIEVFATPGEYEPVTLSLYALEDLAGVRVSFEGLPASGEALPIRCMDKRVTYPDKRFIKGMPVLCERREAVDIAKGTSKRFVIDLHINDGAEAGIHEGRVQIEGASRGRISLPLRLRVLPFKLIEPTDMFWGEYYVRPRFAKSDEEAIALLAPHLTDMRAHGRTSVGLCFGLPISEVEFTDDGRCQLNLDGASLYEKFMDLYRDLGFPAPVILLSDSGQAAAGGGTEEGVDSEEWGRCYQAFWRAMQEEQERRGWPEVIVQPVDEPGWQGRAQKDRNVRCLKLLKQIPGMRTEQDGPGDAYFHDEAGPHADVWNYNGALSKPELVAKAQDAGKIVLIYNCDVESYRPEVDRYTAGWFQLRSGASGCFNWAYISYGGGPYSDQDHKHGDWMHVYPPLGDEPGGPSTGWIGAREGVDDFKYVYTLRETIERAEAGGNENAKRATQAGRGQLAAIVDSIEYSPGIRGRAQWTHTGTAADGTKTIGGTLKQPNGWEHVDYQRARWQVARATLGILAALGEAPAQAGAAPRETNSSPLLTKVRWTDVEAAGPTAAVTADRHVTVPVWTDAPMIDGDLGDDIWQKAARLDPFTLSSGKGAPQQQTDVLLGSDGKSLFIAVTCHENNIGHLTARVTKDGGRVWEDDCIEVFVDSQLTRSTFRQVMVNSLGVQGWNDTTDPKWRAKSVAGAKVGEDRWTVELAIPMADLGITGGEFGFNVCRERRPMETLELSCWSPTGGGFAAPERFGVASLGQAWIGSLRVPPARLGTNDFSVTLKNESDEEARVRNVLTTKWAAKQERSVLDAEPMTLAPGGQAEMKYSYELPGEDAPIMTFQVLAEDGRLLAERTFSPTVLPALRMKARPRTYYLAQGEGTIELSVNLSDSLRAGALLRIALHRGEEGEPLRKTDLSPIEGARLDAVLNLGALPEGSYTLRARLEAPEGRILAEASAPIERMRGPFD